MKKFDRQRKSSWIFHLIFVVGKTLITLNSSIHKVVHAQENSTLFSSSPSRLIELAEIDSNVYELMKEYRSVYLERLDIIDKYISSYEETFKQVFAKVNGANSEEMDAAFERSNSEFQHSLHTLFDISSGVDSNNNPSFVDTIKERITVDIPNLISNIDRHTEKDFMQKLFHLPPTRWPNLKDSEDAKNAIIKLYDVYDFDLTQFTEGKLFNFATSVRLTGLQCYEIGVYAFGVQKYALAVEWLTVALNKIRIKSEDFLSEEIAADTLRIACETHDNHWDSANISVFDPTGNYEPNLTSASFFTNKISTVEVSNPIYRRPFVETVIFKGSPYEKYNGINYRYLCTHGNFQSEKMKSELYCWEESRSHPYLKINPQKMELLNQNPYLVQIHDFVHDALANSLIHRAEPRLRRSMLNQEFLEATSENKSSRIEGGSGYRTSSVAWIDDTLDKDLILLSKKIEIITGLDVTSSNASEPLQIASYMFGGHYGPHLDYIQDERIQKYANGNRVATFMIYLNQVELGGYTVFPILGTAAMPIKGSAVFWYNMQVDGNGADNRTWHGACPVIYGQKWGIAFAVLLFVDFVL